MHDSTGEVTLLLAEMKRGNSDALPKLIPLVYNELRRLAAHFLRDEREGHTLQPTALVHEAYLRLAGQTRAGWQNRAQFMGVAAQLMRRILVDYARQRVTAKRGGGESLIDFEVSEISDRRPGRPLRRRPRRTFRHRKRDPALPGKGSRRSLLRQ